MGIISREKRVYAATSMSKTLKGAAEADQPYVGHACASAPTCTSIVLQQQTCSGCLTPVELQVPSMLKHDRIFSPFLRLDRVSGAWLINSPRQATLQPACCRLLDPTVDKGKISARVVEIKSSTNR